MAHRKRVHEGLKFNCTSCDLCLSTTVCTAAFLPVGIGVVGVGVGVVGVGVGVDLVGIVVVGVVGVGVGEVGVGVNLVGVVVVGVGVVGVVILLLLLFRTKVFVPFIGKI